MTCGARKSGSRQVDPAFGLRTTTRTGDRWGASADRGGGIERGGQAQGVYGAERLHR